MNLPMFFVLMLGLYCAESRAASEPNIREEVTHSFNIKNSTLGWTLLPNITTQWSRFVGEQEVYSVRLSTDEYGRRKIPPIKAIKSPALHWLTFGDSNVFGEGLEDQGTIAYQLQSQKPGSRAHIYANRGWGPQQFWQLVRERDFEREIFSENKNLKKTKPEIIGIYFFMSWHLDRFVGHSRESFVRLSPYLRRGANGKIESLGSFASARPYWTKFQDFFASLFFVKKWNLSIPKPSEEDKKLLCQAFVESEEELQKKIPGIKLYLVLHPTFGGSLEKIPDCFYAGKWKLIDLRSLFFGLEEKEFVIIPKIEPHVSAAGNRMLVKALLQELDKK